MTLTALEVVTPPPWTRDSPPWKRRTTALEAATPAPLAATTTPPWTLEDGMHDLQATYDRWLADGHDPTPAELSAWWIEYGG